MSLPSPSPKISTQIRLKYVIGLEYCIIADPYSVFFISLHCSMHCSVTVLTHIACTWCICAGYCYGCLYTACRLLCVYQLVTTVSSAKMAEPMKMPIGGPIDLY